MYALHISGNKFYEYPTREAMLKDAYRILMSKRTKKHDYHEFMVFRYPKGTVIHNPRKHELTDAGMKAYIGMVWISNSFDPQYEAGATWGKSSKNIRPNGKLGTIGWRQRDF